MASSNEVALRVGRQDAPHSIPTRRSVCDRRRSREVTRTGLMLALDPGCGAADIPAILAAVCALGLRLCSRYGSRFGLAARFGSAGSLRTRPVNVFRSRDFLVAQKQARDLSRAAHLSAPPIEANRRPASEPIRRSVARRARQARVPMKGQKQPECWRRPYNGGGTPRRRYDDGHPAAPGNRRTSTL